MNLIFLTTIIDYTKLYHMQLQIDAMFSNIYSVDFIVFLYTMVPILSLWVPRQKNLTCSGSFFRIFSFSASSTRCGICSNASNGAKLAEAAESCESLQTSVHWSVVSDWKLYSGRWRPPEISKVPLAEPGTTPWGKPSSRTWENPASSLKFQILK